MDEMEYGATPVYTGEIPTKDSDEAYSYTFTGWSPELKKVYDDQTYMAEFSKELNIYIINITYLIEDKEIKSKTIEIDFFTEKTIDAKINGLKIKNLFINDIQQRNTSLITLEGVSEDLEIIIVYESSDVFVLRLISIGGLLFIIFNTITAIAIVVLSKKIAKLNSKGKKE